ncbi:MAG: gas vesicle protein GvpG [Sphingomonadales bacterium]
MGLLTKLLTFPISVPAAGMKGLFVKIYETVEGQYYNAEAVRAQMVALGDQLDAGEISEEEFEELEEQLLDRLDEIAAYEQEKLGGGS